MGKIRNEGCGEKTLKKNKTLDLFQDEVIEDDEKQQLYTKLMSAIKKQTKQK